MLVKMLEHITGLRDGKAWPPRGGIIELPDQEALSLIAHAYAQPIPPAESPAFAPRSHGEGSGMPVEVETATLHPRRSRGSR